MRTAMHIAIAIVIALAAGLFGGVAVGTLQKLRTPKPNER